MNFKLMGVKEKFESLNSRKMLQTSKQMKKL